MRSRLVAAVLVPIAVLASCGSDDDAATTTTSVDVTTTAVEPTTIVTTAGLTTVAPTTVASTPVAPTTSSAAVTADASVVSFVDAAAIEGWSNVDDTVMGGVSASTTSWEDGRLVFAGELSLENNGGFTSVRGPQDPELGARLADADALELDAVGDGRTYVLQLRTADESLYIARFTTLDGVEQVYDLPLADFEPVTRFLDPAPGSPPLDPATVVQLAIYLLDGQEGPFRLALAGIDAR